MTEQPPEEKPASGGASGSWTRFAPIAVIAAAAALFFLSGAHRYLSLDALKEHRETLEAFVRDYFLLALGVFILAYIAATALSLPGATVLSILGGFLFGTVAGTVVVIFSATIGATLIFLAAKTAFRDLLRKRAGKLVKRMEEGFRKNAFSYLLLLRLIPLFPFFVVNVAPAFFGVKTRTFVLATMIGIIPGVFAFVSAGNGLGAVLAAGGELKLSGLLLQPAVLTPIIALSILALIPVALRFFNATPAAMTSDNDAQNPEALNE